MGPGTGAAHAPACSWFAGSTVQHRVHMQSIWMPEGVQAAVVEEREVAASSHSAEESAEQKK